MPHGAMETVWGMDRSVQGPRGIEKTRGVAKETVRLASWLSRPRGRGGGENPRGLVKETAEVAKTPVGW